MSSRPTTALVRVLHVEDDTTLATLVAKRLSSCGWELFRESTCGAAAARLRTEHFDLVILDHLLPDGTGMDLLALVREHAPETPVLLLTGRGSEGLALEAAGRGVTDYMEKNGQLVDELPARLETLLARAPESAEAAHSVRLIPRAGPADEAGARHGRTAERARAAIDAILKPPVLSAAVYNAMGDLLAERFAAGWDAARFGGSAAPLHAQAGLLHLPRAMIPRAYRLSMATSDGTIILQSVPGGFAVVHVDVRTSTTAADGIAATFARRLAD